MASAQILELPDGRQLAYDDVGDPDGTPVLFVHGTPDSRRARHPDDAIAASSGIRLVAPDRPGFGGSHPHRHRTLATFADDAAALGDHLGVERWRVFGWSGGGPYALAVAARHGDRVARCAVAAGLVPFTAYATPGVLDGADPGRLLVAELGDELGPEVTAEMAAPMLAPHPCDLELARAHVQETTDPTRLAAYATIAGLTDVLAWGVMDAVSQGLDGLVREVELQVETPDVEWSEVVAPTDLWYGELDSAAPPGFGRWWEANLPHAQLHLLADEGHLIAITQWRRILATLADRDPAEG
jgi:pimeloyl-ACP methyl ester carboxylesterase